MRRESLLLFALVGCATPGARYFSHPEQSHGCDEVREARTYADAHPELANDTRADLLLDLAHCEAEAGKADAVEPLLTEALKLDAHRQGDADAERAALAAQKGDLAGAQELLKKALAGGFKDLDLLLDGKEFDKLVRAPELEKALVALAAGSEPVAPRIEALASKLGQNPVTPVVVQANPKYGLNTFTVWRGRVLESHYDEGNDETTVLLEELAEHAHAGQGEAHQHFDTVWSPYAGFVRQPHAHLNLREGPRMELEATGRFFGLRVVGFPRELVEAPDLEVVGYYVGTSPFALHGEQGEAATLEVVRAVPFNSGVHLGTPIAHSQP